MGTLGQLEFVEIFRMRAAPILQIPGALEREFALQVALDEMVIFDELAVEARRRRRSLRTCR
jgi:hypothetical protein